MAWKGEVLANNEAGQVTSIIYNPGDVITIVAAGWASYGPTQKWGPQGDREHPDQGLICHDAFCGALVMKIGNSGTIPVNTGLFRWVAPNNVQGAITLIYNDVPGTYGNNSGLVQRQYWKGSVLITCLGKKGPNGLFLNTNKVKLPVWPL